MKLSKEIAEIINRSNDFFLKANKLLNTGLEHLAISSVYLSLYHAISALAYKNGSAASNDEELMRWFQEFNEKQKICNSQLPQFFRKLYIEKQNIEYKNEHSVSNEKVKMWYNDVEKYRKEIIAEVKKAPDYSNEIINHLKYYLRTEKLEQAFEDAKKIFISDLKLKVLNKSAKVTNALNELLGAPDKLELFGAFKIRFQDFIEEHPEKNDEIFALLAGLPDLPKNFSEIVEKSAETATMEENEKQAESPKPEHPIIVPWDFTKIAEYALEHAVNFARLTNGKIYLLHVIKKDSEKIKIEPKLRAEIQRIQRDYNVESQAVTRSGSIFSLITSFAEEIKAKLVIMGTHGKQGMQKFTGSNALKVMLKTKVPFIIVQKPPRRSEIKNVVFPVDYRTEIKQKVNQARYLNKYYNLKFYISKPEKIAIENIRKKTLNNLYFMRSFFIQNGIDHEIVDVKDTKSWSEATLKLANELNTDLIIIVLTKELGLPDMLFGAEEEKIILNLDGIPVMCINPPQAKNWTYTSGFG